MLEAKRPDLANVVAHEAAAAEDGTVLYLTYEIVLEMQPQEVKVSEMTNRLSAALAWRKFFPDIAGIRIKEKSAHRAPPHQTSK